MDRWRGRVALVTGVSAGIGADVARTLVRHGMTVVGCARRADMVQKLAASLAGESGRLIPMTCDLRQEDQINAMFDRIRKEVGRVDVCVNNAGLGAVNTPATGPVSAWRAMLETNVLALAICTKESLALMKENNINDGHIIHISSLSGHRLEGPEGAFYAATKHAVKALTEGLRMELCRGDSMTRVTAISPGNVDTEFLTALCAGDQEKAKEWASPFKELEASDITDAVIYALSAPPNVQIHDILIRPTKQPT